MLVINREVVDICCNNVGKKSELYRGVLLKNFFVVLANLRGV